MTTETCKRDEESNSNCKAERGYLNKGEEDEMVIYGYKEYLPYRIATWSCIILTFGLLRLVFHWWPRFMLYSTHRPTSLKEATKLLIVDTYEKRFKSFFVKEVKYISPADFRTPKIKGGDVVLNDERNNLKLGNGYGNYINPTFQINLSGGYKKDVSEFRAVWIKKLCYVWADENMSFLKLVGLEVETRNDELHAFSGYSESDQLLKQIAYGTNEININIQSIPTLLILEILNPFYFFQIFTLIVWLCENYYYFSIAIIIMSIFGIASSVIQTHKNQKNLHHTIHSYDSVIVKREGMEYEEIASTNLVPGDIIIIPSNGCIMQCDAVLLQGTCIVNESMLTGESVPVTKTALPRIPEMYSTKEDSHHTLFCGTKILQTRFYNNEKVHAVVIRTGFHTTKGSLVRSILYPPPADFKFDQDSYKFIWILGAIGCFGFIYTLLLKFQRGFSVFDIIIKGLDLLTITIPPALPAAMTVGKIYGLSRLKKKRISCINSRVINVSGSLNCVCFDKTGTLTEDGLDMWGVIPVSNQSFQDPCNEPSKLQTGPLLFGMATCHSLTIINGKISGDPLDLKMFDSTGWKFEEPKVPDSAKFDLLAPTVVQPGSRTDTEGNLEIGILHQYQFSSKLQRMSVVARKLGSNEFTVYCKGSPEMIISLSNPLSVPQDSSSQLKKYTEQGYRVLAIASKNMPSVSYHHLQRMKREEVENDLEFSGLVVLENRLKPETIPTLSILKNAKIKLAMITGDNIQTAISVARESGLVEQDDILLELRIEDTDSKQQQILYYTHKEGKKTNIKNGCNLTDCEDGTDLKFKLAMTGASWMVLKEKFPEAIPQVLVHGVVFARMSSDQKQQIVLELQQLGFCVAMCGDGANDCGALKAANVGISLSEAEASVASPFTSQEPNITCVTTVIKEGRAALTTSFGVFKFMVLYSLTEFMSTLILYNIDSNLTDFEFFFIDVGLAVNFAFFFGQNEAYKGPLVNESPLTSLLAFAPILSLILQVVTMFIFQIASFNIIRAFPWYESFTPINEDHYVCYENFAVFSVSQFQYIIMAIAFAQGPPFRTPIYENKFFFSSAILMTAICVYITVKPAQWIISLLELKYPPNYSFPLIVLALGALNFVFSMFLEKFIIEYLVLKKMSKAKNNKKLAKISKKVTMNFEKVIIPESITTFIEVRNEVPKDMKSTKLVTRL